MSSYKLTIKVNQDIEICVGKLGFFRFPKGFYCYTGSARKNRESRISRHFQKSKKLYWHIDYLLKDVDANIISFERSPHTECELNKKVQGEILVPGFGSSDCINRCGAHLKYFGLSCAVY